MIMVDVGRVCLDRPERNVLSTDSAFTILLLPPFYEGGWRSTVSFGLLLEGT